MTLPQLLYLSQLEDYNVPRIEAWLRQNPGRSVEEKKHRLVWTMKVRALWCISSVLTVFIKKEKALLIAIKILAPIDSLLKEIIVILAKIKMNLFHSKVMVIGVAGSWGKTTAKETLVALARVYHNTSATIGNNNTIMGVALTVLRLPLHAQVFVCEMDAFYEGEILEVCRMIKPRIGLLTAIGPMHLERFDNDMRALERSQFELLHVLPTHGLGCYPKEFESHANQMMARRFGMESLHDAYVEIGKELGLELEKVERVLKNLPPVEHRRQIIKNGDITVIDDAYNSNPVGFCMALETVKRLKAKQNIIVTPGMIEMGSRQSDENLKAAQEAAKICDVVIIVGETNKVALMEGAKNAKTLVWVKDLEEAKVELAKFTRPGTAILFENDLGDQYL